MSDSVPSEIPSSREDESQTPERVLQHELVKSQGLSNLGRLLGLQSLKRNLTAEDAAIERDMRKFGDAMHGEAENSETEQMEIMAANDVHIHNKESSDRSKTEDLERLLCAAIQHPKSSSGQLSSILLTAALAGGIPLAGIGGYALSRTTDEQKQPPAAKPVEDETAEDNSATIRFLE